MHISSYERQFRSLATHIRDNHFNRSSSNFLSEAAYKSIYGLTYIQTAITWQLLTRVEHKNGFQQKHLLWTLKFLKSYPTQHCMAHDFNAAPGTVMKWVWYTIGLLRKLKMVS